MEAGARRPETKNTQMSETTIKAVKARIVFTDGVKVEVESRPGTDPTKAITKIRELLDSESTPPHGVPDGNSPHGARFRPGSRDTTEAKGTNPGPPESGTTSDGTAQP